MKKAILVVLMAASTAALATDDEKGWKPRLLLENRASYFHGESDLADSFTLEAEMKNRRLARGVFVTGQSYVRYATDGTVAPTFRKVNDDAVDQPAFGFHDLYVDVSKDVLPGLQSLPGRGWVKIGWQSPDWGVTDRIRPTNVLDAYDYTDLTLDDRRVSQIGVDVKWAVDGRRYIFEAVVLPMFTPDRIAREGAWGVAPEGVSIQRDLPSNGEESLSVGGRACFNGEFHLCAVATSGRDKLFFVRPVAPTAIELVYPRLRTYGGDFFYELPWQVVYRLEGVYRDYDSAVARNYGELATSLERVWGDNLFTLLEYVRQVPTCTDPTNIHCVFSNALLGRIGYGDEANGWYEQVEGAANLDPTAYLVEASVTGPTPIEGLRFRLGGRMVGGSRDNLIGARFGGNDGVFFDLVWRY